MMWKSIIFSLFWLVAFSPLVQAQFVYWGQALRTAEPGPSCVSTDGRYYYQGTYRNMIGVYAIGNEGQLSLVEQVKTSNSISVLPSPDGQWLISSSTSYDTEGDLVLYVRNTQTGKLQQRKDRLAARASCIFA